MTTFTDEAALPRLSTVAAQRIRGRRAELRMSQTESRPPLRHLPVGAL
ncbi:hypothetical protein G5V59_00400 [Nocardioides sp. W3-2-3]|nr:hypothetical protein [Nocardioides convexus]NGZ99431.1 hypothetical protein [Nocardioides convexus]